MIEERKEAEKFFTQIDKARQFAFAYRKQLEEEYAKEMANNLGLLFENAKLKLDNEGLKLYIKDLESHIKNDNSKGNNII